jgi:predicted PurR-regulated permease PerM
MPVEKDPGESERFVRQTVTAVGIGLLGIALLGIVVLAAPVFLITFAGLLLGVFLLALRDFVHRHTPLSEGWALAFVITVLVALFGAGSLLLAPQLAEQAAEAGERIPEIAEQIEGFLLQHRWGQQILERVADGEALDGVQQGLAAFFGALPQSFGFLVTFLFVGLFVAVNPALYSSGIVGLVPPPGRARAREVLAEINSTLRWFLVARAIAMLLVGVTTAIAMALLGVPLALLLGVIAALLTFVPYLGPIVSTVPIVLFALLEGPEVAFWALVVYTAIQMTEGHLFDPLILQRVIHLPPVVTVVSQILGGVLLGVLGIALATPLAAVMQVVIRRLYREDVLGEEPG